MVFNNEIVSYNAYTKEQQLELQSSKLDYSDESLSRESSPSTLTEYSLLDEDFPPFDRERPDVKDSIDVDENDIRTLMSRFPVTRDIRFKTPECETFMEELMAKIEQPLFQAGIVGVQSWLVRNTQWGPFGAPEFGWNELRGNLKKLRCTAAAALGKFALAQTPAVQNKEMYVGQCQLIFRCQDDTHGKMIHDFFDENDETPDYFLLNNLHYHECVVKVTASNSKAIVWDYGVEYDAPNSAHASFAIVGFRFDVNTPTKMVQFGNYTVPVGQWFTTCPEINMPEFVKIVKPALSLHTAQPIVDDYGLRHGKALNHQFTVYISGTAMNNGNPCPGVGVARCLRRAFGSRVKLVGFEYSLQSGGLKDPVFDETKVLIAFFGKKRTVKKRIMERVIDVLKEDENAFFISTFDVEIDLLTEKMEECQGEDWTTRCLLPSAPVLESTEKPEVDIIAKHFGMKAPKNIMVKSDNKDEVKAFCQNNGWPLLCKGKKFGCKKIYKQNCVEKLARSFNKQWGTDMFVQEPIYGYEKSYCFASHQGKLLGAVEMRKDMITKEGKCWGVHLEPLSAESMTCLKAMCAESKWTGGGEIEFVEQPSGGQYIIDFNPRFPAWVFGGCHGGVNLPGLLLQECTGLKSEDQTAAVIGGDFIRTCLEIPVNNKLVQPQVYCLGITKPPEISVGAKGITAHPSRFEEIAQMSFGADSDDESDSEEEEINDDDIWVVDPKSFKKTPEFMLHESTLCKTMQGVNDFREQLDIETIVGLSIKTQPHSLLLNTAKAMGWHAECISQGEVQKALDLGFPSQEIIVNGPLKNWPQKLPTTGLKAWFADSFEDYDLLLDTTPAEYVGFRLTPANVNSRFGVPVECWREVKERLDVLPEGQKVGIHFHFAQSTLGSKAWFGMARSQIRMISLIYPEVEMLDFGGGWAPGSLTLYVKEMNELIAFAKRRLPKVNVVCFEPGKSISQSAGGYITQVKMLRGPCGQQRDPKFEEGEFDFKGNGCIVDGMIGDFGVFDLHKHPLFYHSNIMVKDSSIIARSAESSRDVEFLIKSLSAQTWAQDLSSLELEALLNSKICHFSKFLVAEQDGELLASVFRFDPACYETVDSIDMCNEFTKNLQDIINSDRLGLHLLCLDWSLDNAVNSLLAVAVEEGISLGDNNAYIMGTVKSERAVELGFKEIEDGLLQRKYWKPLKEGKDKILGRICMEFDQFGDIKMPEDLKIGDHIMIRECGAYDMTMSYLFGDAIERDVKVIN